MHDAVRQFVASHATDDPVLVLECGGRDVNGGVRDLFPHATWVSVDLRDGPNVDVVADFADYQHPSPADVVVCTEVLEHCEHWRGLLESAAANLRPTGRLLVTCAGPGRGPHSGIDEQPIRPDEWYANIDPADLQAALADHFTEWKVVQVGLDVQAWAVR